MMNYSRITPVIVMVLSQYQSVLAEVPVAQLRIANPHAVVGEPIVVDILLRNAGLTPICSLPSHEIERGLVGPVLQVFRNGTPVAKWSSNTGCLAGIGKFKTMYGNCLDLLQPNEKLRGRALAVFMTVVSDAESQRNPLEEGRYTVTGSIQWNGVRLETEPVVLDILVPRNQDDALASELVDISYASFMGDSHMRMGIHGMNPIRTVKRILEDCPTSVHARLARSRLLVLQANSLKRYGITDEDREANKLLMVDVVSRINEHLKKNNNDPLEIDLMNGKVQLLRRLEDEKKLRQAIDALITKHPNSGCARRAQDMWKRIHSNPNDSK